MTKILYRSAIALAVLGGAALATAPAFARDRTYVYVEPAVPAPPVVAFDPYGPGVYAEPEVPVGPPVVEYAPPAAEWAPVGPEAEIEYGPPTYDGPPPGAAIEVGGY
jgi:hypothetical protein